MVHTSRANHQLVSDGRSVLLAWLFSRWLTSFFLSFFLLALTSFFMLFVLAQLLRARSRYEERTTAALLFSSRHRPGFQVMEP